MLRFLIKEYKAVLGVADKKEAEWYASFKLQSINNQIIENFICIFISKDVDYFYVGASSFGRLYLGFIKNI
jgi:hypothetical protein